MKYILYIRNEEVFLLKSNNVNIKLDKSIGREKTQLVCQGDIIVPDNQPDIENVLEVLVKPLLEKAEPAEGRVNYRGSISTHILYLSKGDNKAVHSMSGTIPINDFIQLEGAEEGTLCNMLLHVSDCNTALANERKVSCKIFADADIIVKQPFEAEVIQELSEIPAEQQKTKRVSLCNTVMDSTEKFTIKESIEIPNSRPNIERILQVDCKISDKDIKVYSDKAELNGEVSVNVLYKGEDESNPMEIQEGKIDFGGSIPLDGHYDNVNCNVRLCIDNCKYAIAEDEDGENRIISLEVQISAAIDAEEEYTVDVLEDAYCLNKHIEMQTTEAAYNMLICKNSSQFPIKEVVEIEKSCPDMLRVYKVSGIPCVDEISIVDNRLIVDGVINMNILYVTGNDDMPVYGCKASLPFSHTIEAKGAKEGMQAIVSRDISNIRFNMLSDREVEVRCMLNMDASVTSDVTESFAVSAEMTDMDKEEIKKFPAIVIYFVKPGDTLWKLSKKYNSTVQSIAQINNIENPDLIYPGQRLLIIKNPCNAGSK